MFKLQRERKTSKAKFADSHMPDGKKDMLREIFTALRPSNLVISTYTRTTFATRTASVRLTLFTLRND